MTTHARTSKALPAGRLRSTPAAAHAGAWAAGVVIVLVLGAGQRAAASEPLPLQLRVETFTEGAAIPFTRLTGNAFNPGGSVGVDWTWLEWTSIAVFQTGTGSLYTHGDVQTAALLGTEFGLRWTHQSGAAVELGLGAAYLHAFSASPRYEKDASGRYVQVPDWGRPRFAPTSHVGVGVDLARRYDVPLAVFAQYGNFLEIPHSVLTPVMPHVTLGVGVRYQPDWGTP